MSIQQPTIDDLVWELIPPGPSGAAQDTPMGGFMFYVLEASHSRFEISINDSRPFRGKLTRGFTFPVDFVIHKIRVFNRDPALPLRIVVQVGSGQPIDNLFNVVTDDVTPILRGETPSIVGDAESLADVISLDTWTQMLPADDTRAAVWLKTDAAAGSAYWAPANPGAASELFSRDIQATAEAGGWVKLTTTSAIWIRHKTAGKAVRALVFKYAV